VHSAAEETPKNVQKGGVHRGSVGHVEGEGSTETEAGKACAGKARKRTSS
jgi:hypothetical protein